MLNGAVDEVLQAVSATARMRLKAQMIEPAGEC
jgi:hypothetical protein